MNELDLAVLLRDLAPFGLSTGDVGTIVHAYSDGKAYEVEFITGAGQTVAVVTLEQHDVRPLDASEVLHARRMTAA